MSEFNHSVNGSVFNILLHSILLLLQADPSCLLSFCKNDMVDLIAGCMHTMASNLLQPSIAKSLLELLQTFLGCDHTQGKVIVSRFIKRVLLDSALWCTMPRETTIYLHEELYRVFNTPLTRTLFTSIIPIQVYDIP